MCVYIYTATISTKCTTVCISHLSVVEVIESSRTGLSEQGSQPLSQTFLTQPVWKQYSVVRLQKF